MDIHALCGWTPNPAEVKRVCGELPQPFFRSAARGLMGRGAGQTVLLYKAFKEVLGSYVDYPAQTIGCCVSRGFSESIDLIQCVRIAIKKEAEAFTPTSHEAVYGMARVDIGGQHDYNDGAVGAWAAQAVSTLGTLSQEAVGFPYDDKICKEWGKKGVPAALKAKAKDHLIKTVSLVKTTDELDDALAGGYPVPVCSNRGFTMTRDANGFCQPKGSWSHCMAFMGVRKDEHPGYLIMQSWGSSVPDGPLALDQPPNSFWCAPDVAAKMLEAGDSWVLSNFIGYPDQKLPTHWNWSGFA